MGRYYKLSRSIKEENAGKITEELLSLDQVKNAVFDEDFGGITIFADPDVYTQVMDRAVNIFAREGEGAELSFQRFVFPES